MRKIAFLPVAGLAFISACAESPTGSLEDQLEPTATAAAAARARDGTVTVRPTSSPNVFTHG